jgi:hypothetical protein
VGLLSSLLLKPRMWTLELVFFRDNSHGFCHFCSGVLNQVGWDKGSLLIYLPGLFLGARFLMNAGADMAIFSYPWFEK